MILRRIKAGPWVESFMAFVIDGHGASEQLDRFAWMAVVRTAFAAAAGSASGLDFSRFPAMTAGGTVRTLRMQADDGGQRSVCPQEGVEQGSSRVRCGGKEGPSSHAVPTLPGLGRSCQEVR